MGETRRRPLRRHDVRPASYSPGRASLAVRVQTRLASRVNSSNKAVFCIERSSWLDGSAHCARLRSPPRARVFSRGDSVCSASGRSGIGLYNQFKRDVLQFRRDASAEGCLRQLRRGAFEFFPRLYVQIPVSRFLLTVYQPPAS